MSHFIHQILASITGNASKQQQVHMNRFALNHVANDRTRPSLAFASNSNMPHSRSIAMDHFFAHSNERLGSETLSITPMGDLWN